MGKDNKKMLLVLLLLLGVGFAAITTTLYVNGTVNITADTADFEQNVKFTAASFTSPVTDEDDNTPDDTISIDAHEGVAGKTITFTTHAFKQVGESAVINYTITNSSTYNAELGTLTCAATGANSSRASEYVSVVPSTIANNTVLTGKNNTTGTSNQFSGTITVSMIKSFTGTEVPGENAGDPSTTSYNEGFTYACTLGATAVEAGSTSGS